MFNIRIFITALALVIYPACDGNTENPDQAVIRTGAEILIEDHLTALKGMRVGLVMNPTARINETHVLDTLLNLDVDITALFAPEHGFRGDAGAGEVIEDGVDQATGLPVYSLYGSTKRPTDRMLESVDVLLFDMQDVGARFYTYNSTMKYVIEAAADHSVEVWILDRPNPSGGEYMAGWILEEEYGSFVGTYPIPVAHGLTLGELALMAEGEGWFQSQFPPSIRVIEMEGWERDMKWPDTGLKWFPPSPNLPRFENAFTYLGTCFFEGTTISEGRGTEDPFMIIGAPSTTPDWKSLTELSGRYDVELDSIRFTPRTIPGKATNPKHEGELSVGIRITNISRLQDPVRFGIELMKELMESTPNAEYIDYLYLLSGTKDIHEDLPAKGWGASFDEYVKDRGQYLLYE